MRSQQKRVALAFTFPATGPRATNGDRRAPAVCEGISYSPHTRLAGPETQDGRQRGTMSSPGAAAHDVGSSSRPVIQPQLPIDRVELGPREVLILDQAGNRSLHIQDRLRHAVPGRDRA